MSIPDDIVIIGTGGGGLTIAADLGLAGRPVTIADQPQFASGLEAINSKGGIEVQFRSSVDSDAPTQFSPVKAVSRDPAAAVAQASLVIISVPSFGHRPLADLLAPAWVAGQTILWVGEGGGSLSAVAALRSIGRRVDVVFGETNSLPYAAALVRSPGSVGATRKSGGTLVSALPADRGGDVHELASQIWPWVTSAENAWETVLLNFNAVDHVPAMVCNLGPIQSPEGGYRLWREGGSEGVANVIGAVDGEYLAIRAALGLSNLTPYEDYLVQQGLVAAKGATLHETIQASLLATVEFKCGPDALEHRFVAEDVPFSLVLGSSLAAEVGVDTPVIDGLIAIATAASGRDYRANGRTVADWGLDGVGVAGLRAAVEDGWW